MRPVPLGDWRRKRGAVFFVFSVVQIKKILNWLTINHGSGVDFSSSPNNNVCTGPTDDEELQWLC